MCLNIKSIRINGKHYKYGYKVFYKTNGDYDPLFCFCKSHYPNFKSFVDATKCDIGMESGFHVFTNLKDAQDYCKEIKKGHRLGVWNTTKPYNDSKAKILKVEVKNIKIWGHHNTDSKHTEKYGFTKNKKINAFICSSIRLVKEMRAT